MDRKRRRQTREIQPGSHGCSVRDQGGYGFQPISARIRTRRGKSRSSPALRAKTAYGAEVTGFHPVKRTEKTASGA